MALIHFGAEGWRGNVAEAFTFAGVAVVAQAIAAFLRAQEQEKQGVLVAFEDEVLGHLFAERVAEVLAGNGVPVRLGAVSCNAEAAGAAVLAHGLAGAVRVTAAQGPAGGCISFQTGTAALSAEAAKKIARYVRCVEKGAVALQVTPYAQALRRGLIRIEHGLGARVRV